jgi:CRISPR-associated protein Csh1
LKDRAAVFWSEIIEVARSYIDEAIERRNSWGLVNEGVSIKKGIKTTYWTLAGWIRHLARLLYYMDLTGVIPMCPDEKKPIYQPEMSVLQPYFTCESGINSAEKAFAFLLGILFGKMTQVQAARGVNVASNALTWLKRLRLDGRDLPELYVKIREKLITYETEQSAQVRELVQEIGRLGIRLGDNINLDTIPTCYFMLLGQSLTNEILPSKS